MRYYWLRLLRLRQVSLSLLLVMLLITAPLTLHGETNERGLLNTIRSSLIELERNSLRLEALLEEASSEAEDLQISLIQSQQLLKEAQDTQVELETSLKEAEARAERSEQEYKDLLASSTQLIESLQKQIEDLENERDQESARATRMRWRGRIEGALSGGVVLFLVGFFFGVSSAF